MHPTADNIIEKLIAGNKRFLEGQSIKSSESSLRKLKDFAEKGQFPKAIILCCSDSRAPVETIFDQDIGVEFAASTFGTRLVMVMGHTQCGAIQATLDHIYNTNAIPSENIHDIVSRIKPHIFHITKIPDIDSKERSNRAVEANVLASVNQLSRSSRLIEGLVLESKIKIVSAVLDLSTGQVKLLQD
jgi:carbonic anhydrase